MICCLVGHKHRNDFKVIRLGKNDYLSVSLGGRPWDFAIVQGTCSRCGVAFEKTYGLDSFEADILRKYHEQKVEHKKAKAK